MLWFFRIDITVYPNVPVPIFMYFRLACIYYCIRMKQKQQTKSNPFFYFFNLIRTPFEPHALIKKGFFFFSFPVVSLVFRVQKIYIRAFWATVFVLEKWKYVSHWNVKWVEKHKKRESVNISFHSRFLRFIERFEFCFCVWFSFSKYNNQFHYVFKQFALPILNFL